MRLLAIAPVRVLFIVLMCAAGLFASVAPRASADEGWTVDRFASEIVIEKDASFVVTETIDVDFGSLQKHGIYREIPIEYSIPGDDKHNRLYGLELLFVTDGGSQPVHTEQSRHGANVQLKLGDASKLVTGKQSYVIRYRLSDALNAFPDHDELYWNVNGADWPVPTRLVTASVGLTTAGGISGTVKCFEGAFGSTRDCQANLSDTFDEARFFATKRPYASGEQMTIVVGLTKGAVAQPVVRLVDKPKSTAEQYFDFTPPIIAITILLLFAGLVAFVANWWRHGRDRAYTSVYYLTNDPTERTRPLFARQDIVVEYTPPDALLPAQMGVLLDERADPKDATATIVQLAVRGYLTIEEKGEQGLFSKKDWHLTRLKKSTELQPFERTILDGLFSGGATEVDVSDLKNKYHTSLTEAENELYDDSMAHKWFDSNPNSARNLWQGIAIGVIVAGGAIGYALGHWYGAALVGAPIIIVGVLLFLTARWMPKRTAKGSEALRRVLGFRLYINTAEQSRQEFNEKANIFAEYLPYAIVFGCVEKWAHVFRDIDTTAATQGWYVGAGPFIALDFSRSLESFSSSVSNVIASTPGASGGSGFSGGFSGGGGGGGGGGSW
jgi:uncharacterized membrane protein YgcG